MRISGWSSDVCSADLSTVKSMHVGLAAANGQRAARLAAAGIEGAAEAFDGEGFLHAFSGGTVMAWTAGLELGRPFVVADRGFEQKRYPCCYLLPQLIKATLAMPLEAGAHPTRFAAAPDTP